MVALGRMILGLVLCASLVGCGGGTVAISLEELGGGSDVVEVVPQDGGGDVGVAIDVAPDVPEFDFIELVSDVDSVSDINWEPQPGEAGYPCEKNSECLSGLCIQTPDGMLCTMNCSEECPFGWECVLHEASLPDEVFVCAPAHMNLCKPCMANTHCDANGVDSGDWCVTYGEAGSFCASRCIAESPCPDGYACQVADSLAGETGTVCMLAEGECGCTTDWADEGALTKCYDENEFGICFGTRFCTVDGLTGCDAGIPGIEVCDDLDNDCDGSIDEDTGGTECSIESPHGTCPGITKCDGNELFCNGPQPAPEACDGQDNNCDGTTDEGFPDSDDDGMADCMEQDKDGDGIVDGLDNCPTDENPEQEDFDLDGDGNVCDLDDDNDQVADKEDCQPHNKLIYPGAPEICNGIDNDCDGVADNGLGATTCGKGECLHTVENCVDGETQVCDPFAGVGLEICDGMDNDCNGLTDESLGQATCGKGECLHTVEKCADGVAQACDPLEGAVDETCDGLDNNCDGLTDNGLGTTTCGLGKCLHTVVNCVDGASTYCDPELGLEEEFCDGKDNDCDGLVDEDLGQTTCGQGQCLHTVANCSGGKVQLCDPQQGALEEKCDGLDNDCDGSADESLGDTTCGKGECLHTVANCVDGKTIACDPLAGVVEESCDGLDNDCDGLVDDGLGITTCGLGNCKHAQTNCIDGVPQECDPLAGKADEVCDKQDNDCDGQVDEELGETSCGQGECAHSVPYCSGGLVNVCDPFEGKSDESCDGKDNDCDGDIDDGLGTTACGLGECLHTVTNCINGVEQSCDPLAGSVGELCDGKDNDCDGDFDEELGQLACGLGECAHVIDACIDGLPQVCDPLAGAGDESCDGLDNNCDGDVDEELGTVSCGQGLCFQVFDFCSNGEEQVCDPFLGAGEETCDGLDNDCDGVPDNADLVCAGCSGGICPVVGVNDGSILEGVDLYYQYSPLGAGDGFVRANWLAAEGATGYVVRIGSTPGADNVLADSELDAVVSAELSGLSLAGAWTGAVYFVTVKPLAGDGAVGDGATSNGIRIAEAASWDGLSTVGMSGGFTEDWPEAGITAFYGRHYFETVTIAADTVVRVQGWGKADGVTESIAASHVAVTSPTDGWLELYANTIEVAGTVTASGRGYGGGGGGGGGSVSSSNRGRGGANGLGGDGGAGEGSSAGGGGGGSPGGKGGYGAQGNGGNGNLLGGGSGATACTGHAGRDGGDGPVGEVGGTGGTAGSGVVGAGGAGEFGKGGANGVVGCDNWTGGGGGGYGAGASGGTQWTGGGTDAGGGGGGGSGGVGGGETPHGGKGAGPFGGNAGSANASAGSKGGYLGATVNGDSSADRSLALGSGGGGGGAGIQETGGGGGGAGGGWLVLYALDSLTLTATSRVLANGAGAGGGGRDDGGHSTSYTGGTGAGGGIRLEAANLHIDGAAHVSSRGGNGSTSNGGTIKLFYEALTGSLPPNSRAGRVYDAGEGSFE